MKWDVINSEGTVVDSMELDEKIFSGKVHETVLCEALKIYQGNKRQGTADTKERGEIAKSNAKPWKQKGTGRARAGRASSPIWRGGGTIFGPTPRSYRRDIPRKVKRLACESALRSKIQSNEIIILDKLSFEKTSTKFAKQLLKNIKAMKKALFIIHDKNHDAFLSSIANLQKVGAKESHNVNAWDLLRADSIIFTKESIQNLSERLSKTIRR